MTQSCRRTVQPGDTTTLEVFLRQVRRWRGRPGVDQFRPAARPALIVDYRRGKPAHRESLELFENGNALPGGYFFLAYDERSEEVTEQIVAIIAPGRQAREITGSVDMSR